MMKGAFNLLDKVLIKENGGKYELCISATPEVNDSKYSAWVKNSTYCSAQNLQALTAVGCTANNIQGSLATYIDSRDVKVI